MKSKLITLRKMDRTPEGDRIISVLDADDVEIAMMHVCEHMDGSKSFNFVNAGTFTVEKRSKILVPLATVLMDTASQSITTNFGA